MAEKNNDWCPKIDCQFYGSICRFEDEYSKCKIYRPVKGKAVQVPNREQRKALSA